jgi:hypothetical protein
MVKTFFALIALIIAGTQSSTVSAQATPSSGWAPVALECTVEPLPLAELNEILLSAATPIPGTPDFDNEEIPYIKPEGSPASPPAAEGVTATIEMVMACSNAGDFLRFTALVTDDYIRTFAPFFDPPLDEDDPLFTPSPRPEEQLVFIDGITDVIELPDGRVSALVTTISNDGFDDSSLSVITLEYDEERERWLVDEAQSVVLADITTIWNPVRGEGYEGVIVPPASASELINSYVYGPVQEFWLPTEDDIATLESGLPVFLEWLRRTTPWISQDLIDRLPEYKRQYAGFIQSGRRLILVNALCDNGLNWQREPVVVDGGGDCFFRITYDSEHGTFERFVVNGR